MQQIRHQYDNLANQLEEEFGPCPAGRQALLNWLHEQIERARNVPSAPASAVAAMIDSGYIRWRAEQLGIDPDWENAPAVGLEFGAMPELSAPDDFDQEDSDIQQLFEGDDSAKGD